ncbi:hypothetical protein STEG23_033532, partial [Scotinomys teguina]
MDGIAVRMNCEEDALLTDKVEVKEQLVEAEQSLEKIQEEEVRKSVSATDTQSEDEEESQFETKVQEVKVKVKEFSFSSSSESDLEEEERLEQEIVDLKRKLKKYAERPVWLLACCVCPVDVPADTNNHADDPDSTNIGTGAKDVEPLNIVTDSQYAERVVLHIETTEFIPDESELTSLFIQLQDILRNRKHPLYVTHIRSHTCLTGPLAQVMETVAVTELAADKAIAATMAAVIPKSRRSLKSVNMGNVLGSPSTRMGTKEPIMATPPKRRALDTVGEKVLRYEAFISDVLQRDLQKVLDHRDKVYEQLSIYLQLRKIIERLQETNHSDLYMQVDLGCNFFVDTVVSDTSHIYVALGYGFFLELTLAEALKFIDRKSSLLTELSKSLTKDSVNIKAHIHMMLETSGIAMLASSSLLLENS